MSREASQELLQTVETICSGAEATWQHEGVANLRTISTTTSTNWRYEPEPGLTIAVQESHTGYRSWDEPFVPCLGTEIYNPLSISAKLRNGRHTRFSIVTYPTMPPIIQKYTLASDMAVEDLLESVEAEGVAGMLAILKDAADTGAAVREFSTRGITFHSTKSDLQPYVQVHQVARGGELVKRSVIVDQKRSSDQDCRLYFNTTIVFAGATALCDELVYTNTEFERKFPPVTAEALEMIGELALGTFEVARNSADANTRNNRQAQNRNRKPPNRGKRSWAQR